MGYRRCWGSSRRRTPEQQKEAFYWTLFAGGFGSYGLTWLILAWYVFTEDEDAGRRKFKK